MDELDALYDAAIAGDADAIAKLEMAADKLNVYEETILHVESENGNTERVRFILREFAKKNLLAKLTKYKHTALHWAIYEGHTENPVTSFQAFLRQGDKDMDTALHAAVMYGHVDIVKLLVEADPSDRHIQNDKGKTPMFIAVEKGYNEIVEIISTTCTAPSLDGPDCSTVVRVKNLDQDESPDGTLYKIMDRDALYAAAIAGDADAKAHLEMEADKLDAYDRTILHIESQNGNTERVRFILREFANKNLLAKLNVYKHTALHLAIYGGHTEVVEILVDAARHLPVTSLQSFLRQGDKDMDTALHAAVMEGNVAIVKLLVDADPTHRHIPNKKGKTPMYIAVEHGFNDVVKLICTTCTALSDLDGPGDSTALHAAVKNRNHDIEVVEVLIAAARRLSSSSDDNDTDVNGNPVNSFQAFLRRGDEDSNSALHIAIMQGNLATSKLLVEADPSDPRIPNKQKKTPFYTAVERRDIDIVKMICTTCTAPFSLYGPGETVLHAVIKNLDEAKKEVRDVFKLIIDVIKRGIIKEVFIIKEVKDVDEYTIHVVLAKVIFSQTDEYKCTVLELAVERNYVEVVELILGIQNPAYKDAWIGDDFIGLMPLIYKAKDKEYNNLVKILTQRYQAGAQLSTNLKNEASLISAISNRDTGSVFRLLKDHGRDLVTFVDALGWTALHHAAYHELDLVLPAIVEAQTKFGHQFVYPDMVITPFYVAAEKRYTSTVLLLMKLWPSWSSAYTAVDKNGQNILHLSASQSKKEMIQGILKNCSEEFKNEFVNKRDKNGNTPLHLLIQHGCFVPEFIRYEGLDRRVENHQNWTPPDMLYLEDKIIEDQVQIKLALEDLHINQKKEIFSSSVPPSKRETKDVIFMKKAKLMIREKRARMKEDTHDAIANCFADAIAGDAISKAALEMEADTVNEEGKTILHVESMKGDTERVGYIVREFANKNLLVKLDTLKQTALHLAAHHGHTQVVEVLIDAARHLPTSSENPVSSFQAFIRQATGPMGNTALHLAVLNGNVAIVKLLVEADPDDSHVQNNEGKTPIYIAAENGYKGVVEEICTTCTALSLDGPAGRTTALHVLIKNSEQGGASDVISMIINAAKRWSSAEDASLVDFEALFRRTDESGSTILQLSVERNYVDAVKLILLEDPAYQHGREIKRNGLMRLIHTAIDEKYEAILKLLRETYEPKISVVHKGVIDLIVAIRRRHRVSILSLLEGNKQLVTFTDEDGWTPLHHAAFCQFDSILGAIIEAQIEVGHQFLYKDKDVSTPFHVAAKEGYTFTVIRLMELWPAWSSAYTDVDNDGRNILHWAASQSKKEMIQGILKCCPENNKKQIVNKQDNNGDTPLHLLIMRGCFIPEFIKYKGLDTMTKNNRDETPLDYFYLVDEIIADQVQIKFALDNIQTDQYWKFWRKSTKRISNYLESVVLPSRREAKDVQFEIAKKKLIDDKHGRMKIDLERYKKRTSTQIVVTALITTITFTVGFTMPGGLHQSGELDQGLVLLSKKTAFNAFMVSDALALLLSTCSLFLYFLESMYEDPRQVSKLNAASTGLNIVSVVAMMLTFITGTYVVLSHSLALAITVSIIGSIFFLFVIVLMIKMVYDRRVNRNED